MSQTKKTLVSQRETSLNNRLLPQKRVLLPDVLQEEISSNVTFISRRETIDPTVEPLQPVRMFIVYENIEVSEQGDSSQYSNMNDTVTYNMRLKPSKNKGDITIIIYIIIITLYSNIITLYNNIITLYNNIIIYYNNIIVYYYHFKSRYLLINNK